MTDTNNYTVEVEAGNDLASPAWTALQTITFMNGAFYFSDPCLGSTPSRFDRLGLP